MHPDTVEQVLWNNAEETWIQLDLASSLGQGMSQNKEIRIVHNHLGLGAIQKN